jgi:predicted Ser/Thr protein kinase
MVGFSELTRKLGDREANRLVSRILTLEEIVITRDGLGQVLQFGGDSVLAVFDNASAALNRALEIQRLLDASPGDDPDPRPRLRIGLHMGEVLVKEGDRIEVISRHVNRAHRLMEVAAPGQILASEVVVDAAKDFIDIPKEHLAIQYYGEFYLKGVGATGLCEVADLRFHKPEPPQLPETKRFESALLGRLELAGYRPVGRLGEGAHGVVYKAEQEGTGKTVAVKVLSPTLCEDPAARQRFAEEADRTRQLNVPGLARVLDARLDHQPPFFVMELVEGKPADVALAGAPPERIAKVFCGICSLLDQPHAAGIIHCDLKPGNVLIRANDSPVLLDFGMAMLQGDRLTAKTSSTSVLGTPAFLAPEVIQGARRGPYTDLYSLGVLLFKVLTGREPFVGESVHQIIQAHLHEDPPLPAVLQPDVADGLQRVCLKALEKNPADRYQSASEMAADLERFLRGEVVRTRPSVYDNLLFHRVQQHVAQIEEWSRSGLMSREETHRLLGAYEGLQRRGLPAVMEGRLFRLWQTWVYLGGWAVVNGALLWLVQHWSELTRAGKLLLGSVPALTGFALAGAMWRLERFRLSFVALIVGVLAVPLLTGVWLYEFKVAAGVPEDRLKFEVFHDTVDSTRITNEQLLIAALATLTVAGAVMFFTRTTTHSGQTLMALVLSYGSGLLWYSLRPHIEAEEWATIGLKCLPLLGIVCAVAHWLLIHPERQYQASPWVYFAALLAMAMLYAVSLHGLKEWTKLAEEIRKPGSFLLLALAGVVQTALGLLARAYLRHRCRLATLALVFVGLVTALTGLTLAGWEGTWPANWWSPPVFGKPVPVAHLSLLLASLAITLLACRYQMFAFLLVGLTGLAGSVHVLGYLYFEKTASWPKAMMLVGTVCFFAALYLELRRTRGNTIDDVVTQKRL